MKLHLDSTKPHIVEVQVACGTLFICIDYDTNGRLRIFLDVGDTGGGCSANLKGIAKLLTLYLNDGRLSKERLIEELQEVDCLNCHRWKGKLLGEGKKLDNWSRSCCNAISKILKEIEWTDSTKK